MVFSSFRVLPLSISESPWCGHLAQIPVIKAVPISVLHFNTNFMALITMSWQIKGFQLNTVPLSGPKGGKGRSTTSQSVAVSPPEDNILCSGRVLETYINFQPRQKHLLDSILQIWLNVPLICLSVEPSDFQLSNEELWACHKNSAKTELTALPSEILITFYLGNINYYIPSKLKILESLPIQQVCHLSHLMNRTNLIERNLSSLEQTKTHTAMLRKTVILF